MSIETGVLFKQLLYTGVLVYYWLLLVFQKLPISIKQLVTPVKKQLLTYHTGK